MHGLEEIKRMNAVASDNAETPFSQRSIAVTMTGEQWTTILTVLLYTTAILSDKGREVYRTAANALADQIKP